MRKRFIILTIVAVALMLVPSIVAQETDERGFVSGVQIDWPPPVSEVWAAGDVVGTASLPDMAYYYLEYVELSEDLTIPANAPWIPATTAISQPVVAGRLATLDTTTVPDGLYALRLVVVNNDMQAYTDTVLPVRVNNERMLAYTDRVIRQALEAFGITQEPGPDPTPEPTPEETPVPPTEPTVMPGAGVLAVNVRYCDVVDNDRCPIVESLDNRGATPLARSANGSGWLLIRLPSGLEGWVSPTVVTVAGDISGLPSVAPPSPLPPPATANVILNGINTQGSTVCGQTFTVLINVANTGNAASNAGTVTLQDVNIRTGDVTATQYGSYPTINPGGSFVISIPMTTTVYYGETHELRAYVGNQNIRLQYVLGQGNCNQQPTPTPPPPPQEIEFNDDQCFIVLTSPWPAFDAPYGTLITQMAPRAWEAKRLQIINGEYWYSIEPPELGEVWLNRVEQFTQGGCGL